MTVGARGALARFLLLRGRAVLLLLVWEARAAGAREAPQIAPPRPASPVAAGIVG